MSSCYMYNTTIILLFILLSGYIQCCDLEAMVSRLECTRVHFVQVSVSVSRPDGQGLAWSQDNMLGAYACSTITVICSTFKRVL